MVFIKFSEQRIDTIVVCFIVITLSGLEKREERKYNWKKKKLRRKKYK